MPCRNHLIRNRHGTVSNRNDPCRSERGVCCRIEEFYDESKNADSLRAYNLRAIKIEPAGGREGIIPTTPVAGKDSTSISLAELFGIVKQHDERFTEGRPVNENLLNADGTPELMYRGGAERINIESRSKSYYKVHRIIMPDGAEFSFEKNRDIAERAPGNNIQSSLSPTDNISTHSLPRGQAGSQDKLSLKPASGISEELRELIEENEKYKALIGKLNRQLYALQKKVVDPKGVRKLARDVRAEFRSKIGKA